MQQPEIIVSRDELKRQLLELEGIVDRGREVLVRVGEALDEIRSRKLYEPDYSNFDAYCRERFGWARRCGDRHIRWSRTAKKLGPIGPSIENEAQACEMARLAEDFEAAERVWARVGSENGGRHPAVRPSGARRVRGNDGERAGTMSGQGNRTDGEGPSEATGADMAESGRGV